MVGMRKQKIGAAILLYADDGLTLINSNLRFKWIRTTEFGDQTFHSLRIKECTIFS